MPLSTALRLRSLLRPLAQLVRRRLRVARRLLTATPQVGKIDFGDLRRTSPLCPDYGYDRGTPIDRIYIEAFLEAHAADVAGAVLEVLDDGYTKRYGGARVERSDVLDFDPANRQATVIADLAAPGTLAGDRYDAFILTQTLQLVFDARAAVATAHYLLKPGGVLLVTVPGVTLVGQRSAEKDQWCWAFTVRSLRLLLETRFCGEDVEVECFGNVLTATAFLQGIAAEELRPAELAVRDPGYPVTIAARARKAAAR